MTIGTTIADDFFSRAPQYRTKKYLARDVDVMVNLQHQSLLELAKSIREFEKIVLEDGYKMPASFSVPTIAARRILKQIENGKL